MPAQQTQQEPEEEAFSQVDDTEEYVDKRTKKRILDSRDRVNEREDELFNERLTNEEAEYTEAEATVAWGGMVKQFCRDIEVLLRSMPEGGTSRYLNSVELGTVTIIPPDTANYPFSQIAHVTDEEQRDGFRKEYGLPYSAELPQPQTTEFNGLLSVIEADTVLNARWRICVEEGVAPGQGEYRTLQQARIVPKYIYENAVRQADRFLHDVGIGVKMSQSGQDTIRGFDQSGDEPQAEYSEEEFSGDVSL